jgi:aldose 1-epimerase
LILYLQYEFLFMLTDSNRMKILTIRITACLAFTIISIFMISCRQKTEKHAQSVTKNIFGKLADGTEADIYTLTNKHGLVLRVTNYGGTVTSLSIPDKYGKLEDIVLGCDSLKDYIHATANFGAIIGRYGNRIAKAEFILDGITYHLAKNNGPNTLHGGLIGFDKVLWQATPINDSMGVGLELHYISKDGDEGFPGNLDMKVTYRLTNADEFRIDYHAITDKATPLNLTHHSYFNLAGAASGDVLKQLVMIEAQRYTVVDSTFIPTGELRDVKGTAFDFNKPQTIGSRIKESGGNPVGYDINYVLNSGGKSLSLAVRASDPESGRVMEVYTDQPGVQFYTGNFLDGSIIGKGGKAYNQYAGFCFETQKFPDSPNHPAFPDCILKPGETYNSTTIYKFTH